MSFIFIHSDSYSSTTYSKFSPSLHLGTTGEYRADKHILLNPSFRLVHKGVNMNVKSWNSSRTENSQTDNSITVFYLQVPLKMYIDFGRPNGFIIGGGAYFGAAIGGKHTITAPDREKLSNPVNFSGERNFDEVLDMERFDNGFILSLGYRHEKFNINLDLNRSFNEAIVEVEDTQYEAYRIGVDVFLWKAHSGG